MRSLAKEFGLSDVGLAKICRGLQIPVPSRGYWAKRAAGVAPPRPALPKMESDPPVGISIPTPQQLVRREEAAKKRADEQRVLDECIVALPAIEFVQSLEGAQQRQHDQPQRYDAGVVRLEFAEVDHEGQPELEHVPL